MGGRAASELCGSEELGPGVLCSLSLSFPLRRIFTKVVLEAPLITESALEVIRKYCEDEVSRRQSSLCAQHLGGAGALLAAACGGDRALHGL